MIRIVNIVVLAITVMFAFGLYKLKYNTSISEDQLVQLQHDIEQEQRALRVLKAEWSHLNRPERIQALAARHLELKPLDPSQILEFKDIPFSPVDLDNERISQQSIPGRSMGGPELPMDPTSLPQVTDSESESNTRGGNADG